MLFETTIRKKFIYPAAIQSFLMLEDAGTAKRYTAHSIEMDYDHSAAQKAADERRALAKLEMQERARAPKKAKKPAKKAKTS